MRLLLAGIVTAILVSYIGPVRGYLAQRTELAQETARLDALEAHRQQLVRQLRAIDRPAVLERRARELGLVRPGERPFLVEGLDSVEREAAQERARERARDDGGGLLGWLPGV